MWICFAEQRARSRKLIMTTLLGKLHTDTSVAGILETFRCIRCIPWLVLFSANSLPYRYSKSFVMQEYLLYVLAQLAFIPVSYIIGVDIRHDSWDLSRVKSHRVPHRRPVHYGNNYTWDWTLIALHTNFAESANLLEFPPQYLSICDPMNYYVIWSIMHCNA